MTTPSTFQAEILNQLPTGSIDALLFKQDQLFAEISGIEPNDTAGFNAVTQLQFQVNP